MRFPDDLKVPVHFQVTSVLLQNERGGTTSDYGAQAVALLGEAGCLVDKRITLTIQRGIEQIPVPYIIRGGDSRLAQRKTSIVLQIPLLQRPL